MEGLVKGDIVVLPFPFSNLSTAKRRPALAITNLIGDDIILCQISSQDRIDRYSITLREIDFKEGRLPVTSMIRIDKLFTADKSIIIYKIGSIKQNKMSEVEESIIRMIKEK